MRIIHVARHGGHDNDDEGAISYALEQLGHSVVRLSESCSLEDVDSLDADFILCHKWENLPLVSKTRHPVACWYFDLLFGDGDPRLRMHLRRAWAGPMASVCTLMCCTDGDWVSQDRTGKLRVLRQGADERKIGPGTSGRVRHKMVFTGVILGLRRRQFVKEVSGRYPLHVVGGRGYYDRVHGRDLADLLATYDIAVAPDSPVTDRYWSNRVYLTLGFGGFLLHPYAADLTKDYEPGSELVMYRNMDEFFELADYYLEHEDERRRIANAGYARTVSNHLYRHRCAELVKMMEERL